MSASGVSPLSLYLSSRLVHQSLEASRYGQFTTKQSAIYQTQPVDYPAVRTVVIRDFYSSSLTSYLPSSYFSSSLRPPVPPSGFPDFLLFTTDSRSAKVQALRHSPLSEMVCWFPLSQEQYRFSCVSYLIDEKNEIQNYEQLPFMKENSNEINEFIKALRLFHWKGLSNSGRLAFESAHPGARKSNSRYLVDSTSKLSQEIDYYEPQPISVDEPSKHFLLVLGLIWRCDWLKLPNENHQGNSSENEKQKRKLFIKKQNEWKEQAIQP
jgi:hypothetical protein